MQSLSPAKVLRDVRNNESRMPEEQPSGQGDEGRSRKEVLDGISRKEGDETGKS